MLLYHFTHPDNVPSILRDGLRADRASIGNNLTGFPVVWLTDVPTLDVPLEERRALLRVGILCGPRCRNLPHATVCLNTIIPTNDRRLTHFASWLRKHRPGIDPASALVDQHNWFYRGDIARDRLTVFKTVPRGLPTWDLGEGFVVTDAKHEADLLAGRAGPEDYVKAHMEPDGM
jgi:hypothetical protein